MITDDLEHSLSGESTSQTMLRYLLDKGIQRSDFTGEHLRSFYDGLNPSKDTAINSLSPYYSLQMTNKCRTDPVWGVIVETREHPLLESVVCQFARQLKLNIQIFHGTENKNFILDSGVGDLIARGQVHLTDLGINTLTPVNYNNLLLSRPFWDCLYAREKILIFQTDAILCDNSAYTLDDFLQFDYIGSNWNRNRPIGIVIDGGSGGLSLRDWQLTTQCLDKFPSHFWPGGEDGYFAFHFDLIGGRVAKEEDCGKFSTQSVFSDLSFGAHQIQNLNGADLDRFLEYCPAARNIPGSA